MREQPPNDLRVEKTLATIRSTFEAMICEMDYGKITVTGLCERARINKKTFYRYYETLDDLLREFQEGYASAYAERIRGLDTVRDQAKLVRALFEFSAEQGAAYERILRDLDLVKREEFEAVKDMARLAREENEALKARIAALEKKIGPVAET